MTPPRRIAAWAIGAALLLAAVAGSGIMGERRAGGNVAIRLLANTRAAGAMLVSLILTFGPISGAHFNPAVTLADASQGGLSWGEVPGYVAAQIAVSYTHLDVYKRQLHLSAGQHRDAVADCRALLALWQAEANPAVPEIAAAEGHLARACLEAGDPAEAEALARQAAPVLTSWDHPGAASCRITLALVTREPSCAVFDDALRTIESHPLLSPTEKTRLLEAERARISRSGPVEGAATWERLVPVVCT